MTTAKLYHADNFPVLAQQLCESCDEESIASLGQALKVTASDMVSGSMSKAGHLAAYGEAGNILVKVRSMFVPVTSVCHLDDLAKAVYTQCTTLENMCTADEFGELNHQVRAWYKQECTFKKIGIWTGNLLMHACINYF